MVSVNTAYSTTRYATLASSFVANVAQQTGSAADPAKANAEGSATNVTLSSAARAALAPKDFATLVSEVRAKLEALMQEAGRTDPLENGKLAIDLSSLDQRELYAMASNGEAKFSPTEQKAAELETQRRFEAALAAPLALARVTGNYQGLYKAAADHFDAMGPEQKATPEWIAGRAALTEGLKQLQVDPKKLPTANPADPITRSSAIVDALVPKDFTTVVSDSRAKLNSLLQDAGRTNPLEKGKLAIDLSSLDQRELYAISSNGQAKFTPDEQKAAGLEMQRRFDAALASPAALARVTGNYQNLYKAAAEYFDALGPEEKADPEWVKARAALTDGLKQLETNPKKLPTTTKDDPVALYLALAEAEESTSPRPIGGVADQARKTLDQLYADAIAKGKAPTFNRNTTVGTFIDMTAFDSRSLSSIILDGTTKFSEQEVNAAKTAMRTKSGAALVAGFQNAAKSSDPTAFSQNVISLYSAMSPEERQAAGWSEKFYQAALSSYSSTAKMLEMFGDSGADKGNTGITSWFSK